MRILHVVGSLAPGYGGPSTAAPDMCAALAGRGHEVELFTTDCDGDGRLDVPVSLPQFRDGVVTTYFPVHWPRGFVTSRSLGMAVARRLDEFDVVHVHSLFLFHGLVTCSLARRRKIPYVLRPHGTLGPFHRAVHPGRKAAYTFAVERRNLERAAAVHCTSQVEREHVTSAFPKARAVVVPLAVAPAPTGHAKICWPEGRRLVTFLGRLTAKKRPLLLLEAFALVARHDPTVHLVLAGPDGEGLATRILRRASDLGVADRVTVSGLLDRATSWRLLGDSAVFVLPSIDENFGVAVVEAMAAAVPVVITRGVAIHEEIFDRGAGLVAEATAEDLAATIGRVLADDNASRRMGSSGTRVVRELFSWDVVAQQLESLYSEARQFDDHPNALGRRGFKWTS